jgi:hypothetical protein
MKLIRPRLQHRQLAFTIVVTAVTLALAGCGGSTNPLHAVQSSATKTLTLTAQSTLTLDGARLFGATPATIQGRAQYSFRRGLGYEALHVPAPGGRAPGTAYLVFLPRQIWSKPVSSSALPKGRLWISATFGAARSAGSAIPSLALTLEGMNPQLLLQEIAKGAVAATSSGHRVVNHLPFSDYVVSVDLARALAATPAGALRTAMQQELAALRAAHAGSKVKIVAGVDGGGRITQLQASVPGSKLGTVQISLLKFGSTVPLSLPLRPETVDIASLPRSHGVPTGRSVLTGESP